MQATEYSPVAGPYFGIQSGSYYSGVGLGYNTYEIGSKDIKDFISIIKSTPNAFHKISLLPRIKGMHENNYIDFDYTPGKSMLSYTWDMTVCVTIGASAKAQSTVNKLNELRSQLLSPKENATIPYGRFPIEKVTPNQMEELLNCCLQDGFDHLASYI